MYFDCYKAITSTNADLLTMTNLGTGQNLDFNEICLRSSDII